MPAYTIGGATYNGVGSPATAEVAPQNGGQQLTSLGGYDLGKFSFPCPTGDNGVCSPIGGSARIFRCNVHGGQYSSIGEASHLSTMGVMGDNKIWCDIPLYVPPTLG
jgi:hypothetical protein